MKTKSLGQIAYEACEDGGKQNWGKWEDAPALIRDIHERMAEAVIRAYRRRGRPGIEVPWIMRGMKILAEK
jgi:hypothetical protein